MKSNIRLNMILIFCGFLGLVSTIIAFFDIQFKYQHIILFLHLLSFLLFILSLFIFIRTSPPQKLLKKHKIIFLGIMLLSIITRFIFLNFYPFVSFGDEVRDGGHDAYEIYQKKTANIFTYGSYNSHGLIIPTFASFFYPLFENSNLLYRFPSALISVVDIALIFFVSYWNFGITPAVISSLAIISLPLHLFYSRTQMVVIFSSFLTTFFLLLFTFYKNPKKPHLFLLIGYLCGFSFNFHASIRPISLIIILFVIVSEIKNIHRLLLFLFFIIVGFGPRLIFTPLNIFFHTTRLTASVSGSLTNKIWELIGRYITSLLVLVIEPTQSFFKDNRPILNMFYAALFFVGIIFLLKRLKKRIFQIILILVFAIPLTNSAITDGLNFDHRLAPLLPLGAILIGCGFFYLYSTIKFNIIKYIFLGSFISVFLLEIIVFFVDKKANHNWENHYFVRDYLSMHLIYFLQKKQDLLNKSICVAVSPNNIDYFTDPIQIEEKYGFFLPDTQIEFKRDELTGDNEAMVSNSCYSPSKENYLSYQYSCPDNFFKCPDNFVGNILIYSETP